MKLARDGIQLSFDVAGMGSPQFLFVHGLGGDLTHFAAQMEYFARQGRTLNAELRGHGASDKPKQDYSIEGFAEDLVWLCARQQITQPVIVGQSMGGNMALEIAARYPEFPAGLVLLDSGVLFPASAGTVFAEYLEGLRGPNFADQVRKIVADSCLPTDRCRAHVEQTFLATPQHVMVSTFESLFPWDVHRASDCAQACRVPVLYIEAAHRLPGLGRLAHLCRRQGTGQPAGAGRFF